MIGSCTSTLPPGAPPGEMPVIESIETADPALEGTLVRVSGSSLDLPGHMARLHVTTTDGADVKLEPAAGDGTATERFFRLSADALADLGIGEVDAAAAIEGNGFESEPFAFSFTLADELDVSLTAAPSGDVHHNDDVVLRGAGFIAMGEGTLVAHFEGTFMPDAGGSSVPVDAAIPVDQAERFARDRGVVRLTTDIGGVLPGTFDGTVQLDLLLLSGSRSSSSALPTTLHFGRPEILALSPPEASLGQYVVVEGAGFLGGDRSDEATLIRLSGTFTPAGGDPQAFGPIELVPEFESGAKVRFVISTREDRGNLVAAAFGVAQGTFMGQATPIVIKGTTEVEGDAVTGGFVLGPIRQVIFLRFLPGFYTSLPRFGLGAAAGEIEPLVQQRIEGIYEGYNVDVRLEEPDDFSRNGYSVVEIGGVDPNGSGLFGYDNSPGKDIGNLRLFDQIGGTNAETQADGYPGYGGVFVESYLYWSGHPDLPGERPTGAPEPVPLFDEIFDPVRAHAATLNEIRGEGDPARVDAVRRALDALGSIIGETSAHEIGHSLGLAQPYGSPTAFHNSFDGDGCLMDSGGDRPLADRAEQSGGARTILCHDEPSYLDAVLGQ